MLRNYFIIAWRNLVKTKGYSLINIGGLSVGIAIAMLIGLWLADELSFNKYHKNYDRIAQVMTKGNFNGQRFTSSNMPRPLEQELRKKYGSNFKRLVMSRYDEDRILSAGDKKILQRGRFMQPDAPEMLSLRMLKGSSAGLQDPASILISASVANAIFGNIDPVGKMMQLDNKTNVKVTGVYEDIPYNSEFHGIAFLCPWDLTVANTPWIKEAATQWGNTSFMIYVQIADNTNFSSINSTIKNAINDNVSDEDKKYHVQPFLNPMSRWHLYSEWRDAVNTGGSIQFVWLFSIIGIFVLLLACINFMNLSTAQSEKRAKEVGIRKAVGSLRTQLIAQFLAESFLVVVISFIIASLLVSISLPWFNQLADKQMTVGWLNPYYWLSSFLFILITALISGSYPAFYLSSFNPVKVLKGTFQGGPWAAVPRKVLVVLQFVVSVSLIIGTIIVYKQIQYAKNRPVGYDRNNLLMVPISSDDLKYKYDVLKQRLKQEGIVEEMSASSSPLTAVWSTQGGQEWRGKDINKIEGFGTIYITHEYGKVVGWQFKDGRDFSKDYQRDSLSSQSEKGPVYSLVINEAAAKYMNFDKPVGEMIKWGGLDFRIIGVIKDMILESPFEQPKQTMYLVNYPNADSWMNIRVNPNISMTDALDRMGKVFKELVPAVPFEYKFADSEYAMKFSAEERIGKLALLFASLAVFISCLGLFGLASFVAEKRTREIGIRKVLGATVYNLWKMLSKDFVLLIVISCIIATPLAYYFLNNWLNKYEYHTNISWWIFAVTIFGSVLITLLTVSFQAIKAAISNPVKSLRSE